MEEPVECLSDIRPTTSRLIQKLPDSTIRVIAAGEIITKPVNVIKELLENSIDAGSTNIRINIEQGGAKLIEIADNGHGIARSNAELLCSRYATSKINCADDLAIISTFGFRGEALASISEMADVEVKTFNMDVDKVGWQASYKSGLLLSKPEDRYLKKGTQIKITNLFSTMSTRRNVLQSGFVNEKKAIIDLVTRYAIHYRNSITLSLQEANSNDLICLLAPMSSKSCIGYFFGTEMENNLAEFDIVHDNGYKVEVHTIFSQKKASGSSGQFIFILFVNNRLVECLDLKKELDTLVQGYVSAKSHIAMTYIDLKVPPCDVDVNTHPAKATVSLHYQVEIISLITSKLKQKLDEALSTRVIGSTLNNSTQTITIGKLIRSPIGSQRSQSSASSTGSQPTLNQERLSVLAPACLNSQSTHNSTPKRPHDYVHNDSAQQTLTQMGYTTRPPSRASSPLIIPPERDRRDLNLKSLLDLRQQVAKEKSKETAKTIKNSIFVGIFDHYRALIQYETKLYAINLKAFLKEQYYQFFLYDLGNFPPIEILPPGNKVKSIITAYLDDIKKHDTASYEGLKYNTHESIVEKLSQHSAMFEDYLSLKLVDAEIQTIPCIMPGEVPNLIFLGKFLSDLANLVDYTEERECLRTMGRVVADFYSEPPANLKDKEVHRQYHELIESKLYVALKSYLIIPEWLFTSENMVQISDTKDLYKVFERC